MSSNGNAPVPPFNLDAEESVVGAMMLAPSAIDACTQILQVDDFYRPSHGTIYQALLELYAKGEPTDAISVSAELVRTGRLEDAGGLERVHELSAIVPAVGNVAHHARIVRQLSTQRSLIRAAADIERLAREGVGSEEEIVSQAEERVFSLTNQRYASEFVALPELFQEEYQRILKLHEAGHDVVGTPTGFRPLDRLTGGFQGGQFVVLAARPSMGKSALALAIGANVVLRLGMDVAMFSLEMSRSELMQRIMGLEARVDVSRLRNGQIAPGDWARLQRFGSKLERHADQFVIDDNGAVRLAEIRSKLRRLKAQRPKLGLVIIDYLQLMGEGAKLEQRTQEVSMISRGLKVLAREIDTPILALSQLNRGPEQRVSDKRPVLSDLRESGSIEQDADIVLFVYRDEYYHPDSEDAGTAEIICAKNRNGPTDTVKLAFEKTYARFGVLHHHGSEEPT